MDYWKLDKIMKIIQLMDVKTVNRYWIEDKLHEFGAPPNLSEKYGIYEILDAYPSNVMNRLVLELVEKEKPTWRFIQGRTNIYADIAQLIENSSDIVYISTTLEDISRMYHSAIPEKIKICEKNGGRVRLLVEMDDPKLITFVKRFNATETRICELLLESRTVAQKDRQMINSYFPLSTNPESDSALYTNSFNFVYKYYKDCSLLWQTANPLKTR